MAARPRFQIRNRARSGSLVVLAATLACAGVVARARPAAASADRTSEYSPNDDGTPSQVSMSRDGRYLLFMSTADDIVPGHVYTQPYIVDRQSGTITAAVHGTDDSPVNNEVQLAALSGDGKVVAFETGASNIISGDSGHQQLYILNRSTGQVTDITAHDGQPTFSGGTALSINNDGSVVAFDTADNTLLPGMSDGFHLIVYRNGALQQIDNNNISPACAFNVQDYKIAISDSGRYVAFTRRDCGLVPGDTNGQLDVFWEDLDTGAVKKVSTPVGGGQSDAMSYQPAISADGRKVVFTSHATNLLPGVALDPTSAHVYEYDTSTDALTDLIEDGSIDRLYSGYGEQPSISPNGRYVAFEGVGLTFTPLHPQHDVVFVRDTLTGRIELAGITDNGTLDNGQHTRDTSAPAANAPFVLDDGTVGFISDAQLVSEADGLDDVFVRDQGPPATQPASATLSVGPSDLHPYSTVSFSAAVTAPDAQIRRYTFDFGDGTSSDPFTLPAAPDDHDQSATHYYANPGTYTATVTATDDDGRVITAATTVTITPAVPPNQPPVAALAISPATGVAPATISLNAGASNDSDGTIVDYAFDFNDGSPIVHGTTAHVSHVYPTAGTYQPSVTVTDNGGATDAATQQVVVTAPPITTVKGAFHSPSAAGKGSAVVTFSVKRLKTGAYKGTINFTDAKAKIRAKCTVDPAGVTRLGYANGAVITAACVGLGPQVGRAGTGSFVVYDNSVFGVTDALQLSIGGDLGDSLFRTASKSTVSVLATDLEGGPGGGQD